MIIEHGIDNSEKKVFISKQLLDSLYSASHLHYPKEFGGILTGIRRGALCFILDFECPDKLVNTNTRFVRHVDNINRHLDLIFTNSNGIIEYLGEWHSHPGGSDIYSAMDKKSMIEISNDDMINTYEPILIIFSIGKSKDSYKLYQVLDEQLIWMNKVIAL